MKRRWWRQLWSAETQTKFPRLKAIVAFEEAKSEGDFWKDWRILANESVCHAYHTDLKNGLESRMLWSQHIVINRTTGVVGVYGADA